MYVRVKNFLSNDVIYVFEVVAGLKHCEIKTFGERMLFRQIRVLCFVISWGKTDHMST